MKRKTFVLSFIVAMALFMVNFASAADIATNVQVEMNSVVLTSGMDSVIFADDTVPVRVTFEALTDADDVRVEINIDGLREDMSDRTERFNIEAGKTYTKLLSLDTQGKLDDLTEEVVLEVEIYDQQDETEVSYDVTLQRESYSLRVLSVDYNTRVSAGETFPVSVVVKNLGYERTDDNYIVASIPELGVSSRGYAGDLIPVEDYIDYDDEEDSVNKVVYLQVPEGTPAGVYEMVITVYNDDRDAETQVTRLVSVSEGGASTVLAATKTQDVNAGETAEFELLIVNDGSSTKIFSINTVSSKELIVSSPSVVAVGPGASKTVTITATVASGTEAGVYTFSADVEGKQVVFAANVMDEGSSSRTGSSVSPSIVGLTVVLVIVFVVLLVVLIILISRKDNTTEEVETSYY